jgi:hypothetical protein
MLLTEIGVGLLGHALQHPWSWIVSVAVGGLIILVLHRSFFHPLRNIPGPFLASISSLWMAKQAYGNSFHRTNIALHEKHGKLVRTGPNEV